MPCSRIRSGGSDSREVAVVPLDEDLTEQRRRVQRELFDWQTALIEVDQVDTCGPGVRDRRGCGSRCVVQRLVVRISNPGRYSEKGSGRSS